MCLEFIVKYLLFIVNLALSLLGLSIIGVGIAILVLLSDVNEIIPINVIPISIIVLGSIIFFIGFLACCGAIRESQCMLFTYAIIVSVLAALKVWLTVVIFNTLDNIQTTVDGWLVSAFTSTGANSAFNILELSFRCCGTTGPDSYGAEYLPPSCCGQNIDLQNPENTNITACPVADAFDGCSSIVAGWFDTFGGAVGWVLIVIIVIECVAVVFSLFFCNAVRSKRRSNY